MKKYITCIFILLIFALLFPSCTRDKSETTTNPTQEPTTQTVPEIDESTTGGEFTENIVPIATEGADNNIPINAQPEKENADTTGSAYTGRAPLPLGDFSSYDPYNSKNLPTTKIAHAYGAAKNGEPNIISTDFQKFFDVNGYNAICLDTKTTEKVLYLTFDCGYENGYTAKILDTLAEKGVTAAFFCTLPEMKGNPELIARMINEGHVVGNHSNKHPSFAEITRTRMAQELQAFDDYLRTNFGYTAPVFRFPKGEYSESALDLVQSLGYKSIFWSVAYSDWDLNNQKGKEYAFSTVTARLHPGAVILLHSVSPDNAAALGDIIDWAQNEGYTFCSLI